MEQLKFELQKLETIFVTFLKQLILRQLIALGQQVELSFLPKDAFVIWTVRGEGHETFNEEPSQITRDPGDAVVVIEVVVVVVVVLVEVVVEKVEEDIKSIQQYSTCKYLYVPEQTSPKFEFETFTEQLLEL